MVPPVAAQLIQIIIYSVFTDSLTLCDTLFIVDTVTYSQFYGSGTFWWLMEWLIFNGLDIISEDGSQSIHFDVYNV